MSDSRHAAGHVRFPFRRFPRALGTAFAIAATALALLQVPAHADTLPDPAPAIAATLDQLILPAHRQLQTTAAATSAAIDALCAAPAPGTLTEARSRFRDAVQAFSAIEVYRFGPARDENRFERLFFWPDRRGRGLRQVANLMRDPDPTALNPDTLYDKSVAVQGLLALDYVLSNDDSVLTHPDACRYAMAIAQTIQVNAGRLLQGWTGDGKGPEGFAALMRRPGPENPIFRDEPEVLRTILDHARTQLQTALTLKVDPALNGASSPGPDDLRPKRLPFWRSGADLTAIVANVQAVEDLFGEHGLALAAPEAARPLLQELHFELDSALSALRRADDQPGAWPASGDAVGLLAYSRLPLSGALDILTDRLPPAMGLIAGFNALDGD